MGYTVRIKGQVIREFDDVGDLNSYLADRVYEWTEMGFGYQAYLGSDYLELVNDRGNTVTLTISPPVSTRDLFISDDTFAEWDTFK